MGVEVGAWPPGTPRRRRYGCLRRIAGNHNERRLDDNGDEDEDQSGCDERLNDRRSIGYVKKPVI